MYSDTCRTRIYVLDDDAAVRQAFVRLLESVGHDAVACDCEAALVRSIDDAVHDERLAACLLLDLDLPQGSGLQVQQRLNERDSELPIIYVSGCADVPTAARAMRAGALDFLAKPVDPDALCAAVDEALALAQRRLAQRASRNALRSIVDTLTLREREVLLWVTRGLLNKQIADRIGTCEKTVKVHRAHLMRKLHARSVPELVRIVDHLGLDRSPAMAWRSLSM